MAQTIFNDTVRTVGMPRQPVRLSDPNSLGASIPQSVAESSTVFLTGHYTDVGSHVSVPILDRYELEVSLARRFGRQHRATAWRLGGAMWLGGNVALVAAAGQAAPNLPTALPGGRYTTVGFRFALGAPSSTPYVVPPTSTAPTDAAPARLDMKRARHLVIVAPATYLVEAMGDFTDRRERGG